MVYLSGTVPGGWCGRTPSLPPFAAGDAAQGSSLPSTTASELPLLSTRGSSAPMTPCPLHYPIGEPPVTHVYFHPARIWWKIFLPGLSGPTGGGVLSPPTHEWH